MAMSSLRHDTCAPLPPGTRPLDRKQAMELATEAGGWTLAPDGLSISNKFQQPGFAQALAFFNDVGRIAISQKHFPEISLQENTVEIILTTPEISGLSRNDFVLAAKISALA